MNFLTHIQMAKTLYRHLRDNLDLDPDSFIYGNIKPDCTPKSLLLPHTLTNHLETVLTLADKLQNEEWTREGFSETLGELCHYLCDFFCLYHAKEEKFYQLIRHAAYEFRLEKHHARSDKDQSIFSFHRNPVSDLKTFIVESREAYFLEKHKPDLDLFYAYRVCKLACESVAYYASQRFVYGERQVLGESIGLNYH